MKKKNERKTQTKTERKLFSIIMCFIKWIWERHEGNSLSYFKFSTTNSYIIFFALFCSAFAWCAVSFVHTCTVHTFSIRLRKKEIMYRGKFRESIRLYFVILLNICRFFSFACLRTLCVFHVFISAFFFVKLFLYSSEIYFLKTWIRIWKIIVVLIDI